MNKTEGYSAVDTKSYTLYLFYYKKKNVLYFATKISFKYSN